MRSLRWISTACTALLLGLLATPAASWAATFTIDANPNLTFSPPTLTIQVGDSVTWRNQGGTHNVHSDDANFRCAETCQGEAGGDGLPSSLAWTFTRTFNQAGTFVYFCDLHGTQSFGMRGTLTVEGAGPEPTPGTLRFAQAAYSVSEAGGNATITVSRINGADGAVAVTYGAAAGTASSPQDFTAGTGTLNWANGDAANKSFTVPIVNDTLQESNETVLLSLSSPTGGAVLDDARKSAALTIQDNDPPAGGGTPAAPSSLAVTSTSTSEVDLSWNDNSINETGFRIEQKTSGGSFSEAGSALANATTFTALALDPSTLYSFRVRAAGSGGTFSPYSNEASATTDAIPTPCVADATTLCVNGGRFKVTVDWRTPTPTTGQGQAVPIPSAPDSGLFYFFNPGNIEMLIKVLNGCGVNQRYWVFFAATTNVEFTLKVTDSQSGEMKVYSNPLNQAALPIQDTNAFATCP